MKVLDDELFLLVIQNVPARGERDIKQLVCYLAVYLGYAETTHDDWIRCMLKHFYGTTPHPFVPVFFHDLLIGVEFIFDCISIHFLEWRVVLGGDYLVGSLRSVFVQ